MSTILVAYDIANARRLRRVASLMTRYGVRVQKSVFECDLPDTRREEMACKLADLIEEEDDQVRIYAVPREAFDRQDILGKSGASLPEEVVIG